MYSCIYFFLMTFNLKCFVFYLLVRSYYTIYMPVLSKCVLAIYTSDVKVTT